MKPEWIPFLRKHDNRYTTISNSKMLLMSLTTAPIRILLCTILVFISGVAAVTLPTRGVAAVARWVSRSILKSLGISVVRAGKKVSPSEAACVVANHLSFLDILALLSLGCCFVANHGVLNLPGIGKVARAIGCIFVARDSPESRLAAKKAIAERLTGRDPASESYAQLVIFPEGTTTNGRGLLHFRRGAFETEGVTIQPARIDYSNLQFAMALLSIIDLLCILSVMGSGNEITVNFLSPEYPPVWDDSAADEFANRCRTRIAEAPNPYDPNSKMELFKHGSHRDEAELMKLVSKLASSPESRIISLSK
jgi:1-acyl-sn-glycerol-3-phosphate acyltransferase